MEKFERGSIGGIEKRSRLVEDKSFPSAEEALGISLARGAFFEAEGFLYIFAGEIQVRPWRQR